MQSKTLTITSPFKKVFHIITGLLIAGVLTGCASGYGRLQHTDEVTQMFRSGDLPQDYVYYYNGRDHIPYAIIGVSPDYRHTSDHWRQVDPKSAEFRYMVEHLWQPYGYHYPSGAYILDDSGKRIGIWWARYYYTTVALGENNEVTVYSPYRPNLRIGG